MADRETVATAARSDHPPPTWLRRTADLVRERDWFGIAIEIAVVTLGVLFAFQIDQWGQDRRQARDERQFLERMYRDTAEAIRENDWAVALHATVRRRAIEGIRHPNDEPAGMTPARKAPGSFCGLTSYPGLGFNDTNYDVLIASGRLNIVSDPELRAQLREVAAAQADSVTQLNYNRSRSITFQQAIEPYSIRQFDKNGNSSCRIDWPALVKDRDARNAVMRGAGYQILMWVRRAYTRDILAKAHNRIACKLGKPDCLANVPQIIGYRFTGDALPDDLARKSMSLTGK